VSIKGFQGGFQLRRKFLRVQSGSFTPSFFGHIFADVLPKVAKHRHVVAGNIVRHRHARQFDNATLDGIHQRKVAHCPGEKRAFGITGTAQEERCGGQIDNLDCPDLAFHAFKAVNPETRSLIIAFGFFLVISLEVFVFFTIGFFSIAVVRFVIDDQNILHAHQTRHHTLKHLALCFQRLNFFAAFSLKQQTPTLGKLNTVSQLEGVIVGDDDFGAFQFAQHVIRDQFPVFIIAVGIVGLEHTQTVFDRNSRRDHQKTTCVLLASRMSHGIDGLPGNEHGHDGCLPCPRCKFQGQTRQIGIGVMVGVFQMSQKIFSRFFIGGHLGKPDDRFNGFNLAKERPVGTEFVFPPVLKQPGGFRRHFPVSGIGKRAPFVHMRPQIVNKRRRIILLILCGQALALIKD